MNQAFDQEARMLVESAARFIARRARDANRPDDATWPEFAALGWLGAPFDTSVGGFGLGAVGASILMEHFGGALLPTPYLPCVVIAGGLLARCPAAEARLAPLIQGDLRIAAALFEAGRHDSVAAPLTTASLEGENYRLRGTKIHVMGATDAVLVSARTSEEVGCSEDGLGLFLVPLGARDVARQAYVLPDGRAAERLTFNDTEIAVAGRIDDRKTTRNLIRTVFDETLVAAAAENLGAMQALYDLTLEYAKTRKQFGRAIGTFQALQFRLVDMWIRLDEARSLVTSAAVALVDLDEDASRLATAAWIQSLWSGRELSEEAIQIHGAIGMTHDCAIAGYVKRILVNELLLGTADRHLRRYRPVTSS